LFHRGIDPVSLHMSISALCFFNVANRATFSTIFKRDMASPRALAARRAEVVDIIARYVAA
ncbi:MAG: TetR/AcrR family transcriptional regulator, partial [Reyranella sp.]